MIIYLGTGHVLVIAVCTVLGPWMILERAEGGDSLWLGKGLLRRTPLSAGGAMRTRSR